MRPGRRGRGRAPWHPTPPHLAGCERHVCGVSLRLVMGIAGERVNDCSLFPAAGAGVWPALSFRQLSALWTPGFLSLQNTHSRPRRDHSGCVSVVGSTSALLGEDTYFWAICQGPSSETYLCSSLVVRVTRLKGQQHSPAFSPQDTTALRCLLQQRPPLQAAGGERRCHFCLNHQRH